MPIDDEGIRRRLESAAEPAEPADPMGAYERVVQKKARRRVVRRTSVVGLVVVVVVGVAGGAYGLSRAFTGGNGSLPVATTPGHTTGAPTPSVSPSASPTCDGSTVHADFDGDGSQDSATVVPPGCPYGEQFPDATSGSEWGIAVTWGSGSSGAWPLTQCRDVCRAVGTIPMNDGSYALVLALSPGQSQYEYRLLNVYPSEAGPQPYVISGPGAPGFPSGKTVVLPGITLLNQLNVIRCQGGPYHGGGDMATIHVTSAVLSSDRSTYTVTETELAHGPNAGAPELIVVASNTSTVPAGSFDPSSIAGDPCWGGPVATHTP